MRIPIEHVSDSIVCDMCVILTNLVFFLLYCYVHLAVGPWTLTVLCWVPVLLPFFSACS